MCVCVCVRTCACVRVCVYLSPPKCAWSSQMFPLSFFFYKFLASWLSASFSPVSLRLMHSCGHTQAGNTDVTVFPVCSEPLPMWQRLCGSAPRSKCGPPRCQGKLFDYKTHSADPSPGTLPLFYFTTQNTFSLGRRYSAHKQPQRTSSLFFFLFFFFFLPDSCLITSHYWTHHDNFRVFVNLQLQMERNKKNPFLW